MGGNLTDTYSRYWSGTRSTGVPATGYAHTVSCEDTTLDDMATLITANGHCSYKPGKTSNKECLRVSNVRRLRGRVIRRGLTKVLVRGRWNGRTFTIIGLSTRRPLTVASRDRIRRGTLKVLVTRRPLTLPIMGRNSECREFTLENVPWSTLV